MTGLVERPLTLLLNSDTPSCRSTGSAALT